MNEKIKHILIDITIVILLPLGLFYLYMTLSTPGESLYAEAPGAELVGEGQKFLAKLKELQGLTLDTGVFQTAVYASLVDTSVPPPSETAGRPHPFIIPASLVPVSQPATVLKAKTQR